MTETLRHTGLFALVAGLIVLTGEMQSWNTALLIVNMGLISAIMALGVNLQWGFAGLFNVGIMGFVALGGLAAVLVSMPPQPDAWIAGGLQITTALVFATLTFATALVVWRRPVATADPLVGIFALFAIAIEAFEGSITGAILVAALLTVWRITSSKQPRTLLMAEVILIGFVVFRHVFDAGVAAVEAINPAATGYLGGLGLPIIVAWPVGGLLAAGAAWIIGKSALGLRSDYLAIATLGIAEIILAIMKNEDWLARGVKNVVGLPRPVPYEVDLQQDPGFVAQAQGLGIDPVTASSLFVKLGYSALFAAVLITILILAQLALNSPWGRMMRAIRDNETAARAMGKNVTARHLQIFILGSAVCGIAGAMMTTLDGQLTPSSYQPLRFTFLIWVMVIVGGSGNNFGAVLGGFLIWFLWVQVEPMGLWLMETITAGLPDGSALKEQLLENAAHMRLFTMGIVLLLVLRFSPRGLIPEK